MTDTAHRFTYHPPEPEQPEVYRLIRDAGYHFALIIEAVTKPSREREHALDGIDAAVMHANAAIARHGLADPAYAGAADVHDQVLTQIAADRPDSALVTTDTEHWHPAHTATVTDAATALARALTDPVTEPLSRVGISLGSDPWALDVPYAVLRAGLQAVAADAVARGDHHTAAYAHSVLAGEPVPPVEDPEPEANDAPPYLALELALRHVLVQLGPSGTGTVGDLLDYINRVLANDLDAPEAGA